MGRSAHDLGSGDIVLGHFTLGRSYPMRERLAAAREAGVAGVGLFMADLERCASEGISDDDLSDLLAEHELLFVDLDLINLAPRDPVIAERSRRFVARAVELADRFGYRYLQTIAPNAEPGAAGFDETVAALGSVADALAPFDVEVGLEYAGFTTVTTATEALAMVAACGRPNVGHLCRRVAPSPGRARRCDRFDPAVDDPMRAAQRRSARAGRAPTTRPIAYGTAGHPAPVRWTSPPSSPS